MQHILFALTFQDGAALLFNIGAGSPYDLKCEVLPESDHCLSVTFSLEDSDHLAVGKHCIRYERLCYIEYCSSRYILII